MKLLSTLSGKIKNMKIFMAILCIVISMLNMSVPYYMSARSQISMAVEKFQNLLNKFPYDMIVQSGKLEVKNREIQSDGEFAVAFLEETSEIEEENFINLKEKDMDFSLDGNLVTLSYKNSETITLEELKAAVGTSVFNLSTVNLLGAFLMGSVEMFFLLCGYMMISYFLLKKEVRYRVLIKFTGVSLAVASFAAGFAALTITSELMIILICFTVISAAINMLLILPEYNRIKAEEYL